MSASGPPPPPPGLDIHESRQPELYAASITTWVLAVTAVVLRFWCRRLTQVGYKLDDWLIVAALLFALGFMISTLVWIHQGYGLHLWVLTPAFVPNFFKNLFVGEIFYTLVLVFAKYSILAFYRRIFATTIRIPVYILTGFVTCWGLAVLLVTIFQCTPIDGFWNRNKPANCSVDDYKFFIGNAVPNIVTDVAILSLPLPFIFRLHRTLSQKIALAGIFMLGAFVVIVSIVRLVFFINVDLKSPDLDFNFAYGGVWTATEGNIAIVCACLPSLRPVLSFILTGSPSSTHYLRNQSGEPNNSSSKGGIRSFSLFKRSQATSSYGSQSERRNSQSPNEDSDSRKGFARLDEEPVKSMAFSTKRMGEEDSLERDIEMEATTTVGPDKVIRVRNEIDQGWTPRP